MSTTTFTSRTSVRLMGVAAGVVSLAAVAASLWGVGAGRRSASPVAFVGGGGQGLDSLDELGGTGKGPFAEPRDAPGKWRPRGSRSDRQSNSQPGTARLADDEGVERSDANFANTTAEARLRRSREVEAANRVRRSFLGSSAPGGAARSGQREPASGVGPDDTASDGGAPLAPFCGDNIVQADECEPPGTPLCSDDCVEVTDLACFDCEQAGDCWEFSETCLAETFDADQQSLCYDVQECVKDTDCADGGKPLAACFCGGLGTAACMAAPANGPTSPAGACADVIRAAMGGSSVSNAQVLARLINIAFPGGAALARMNCQKLSPACMAACGF